MIDYGKKTIRVSASFNIVKVAILITRVDFIEDQLSKPKPLPSGIATANCTIKHTQNNVCNTPQGVLSRNRRIQCRFAHQHDFFSNNPILAR